MGSVTIAVKESLVSLHVQIGDKTSLSAPQVMVRSGSNVSTVLAAMGARRQGNKAGGDVTVSIGGGCKGSQGRIVVYDIENFRLDMIDLTVYGGNLCG